MTLIGKYFKTNKDYVNVMKVNKKYQDFVDQFEVYPLIDYSLTKEKWELMIDSMMIVGKYFETNNDFINMMKVTKKYHDLVKMYHFNPIDECELFENMETQHFYTEIKETNESLVPKVFKRLFSKANSNKKSRMRQYIYWYDVDYELFKNKKENDVYKRHVLLNRDNKVGYPLPINNGNCIIPEGVTSIGISCFNCCESLTSIQLPSSLNSIGEEAFKYTNIQTVNIPEGVTSIGKLCFH